MENTKQSIRMIFTLMIIAAISGAVLATVYSVTEGKIEKQQEKRIEETICAILPEAKEIMQVRVESQSLYQCRDAKGKQVGWAFVAEGPGYQDTIKVLVVTNIDLTIIKGIEVLENTETPGLGAKITEDDFKNQFINSSSNLDLNKETSRKGEEETAIQAITGATISSKAVVDIINKKTEELKKAFSEQTKIF